VDGLQHVFDYDPLMAEIQDLAADGHYDTQERLITRIVQACAVYPVIEAIDLSLRKFPVSADSGSLGVRLSISDAELRELRNRA
jgi:dihydroneopterin aldolase